VLYRYCSIVLAICSSAVFVSARQTEADYSDGAFRTFRNPLTLTDKRAGPVVSCPDPAIIDQQRNSHRTWYLYCTGDPLNSNDLDTSGNLAGHLITSFRSDDLIHWDYIGDVLKTRAAWIDPTTNLWAPAVKYFNGKYYLYYVAPATASPLNGSAIGVATAASPAGPWTDSGKPVVAPEPAPCCGPHSRRDVIDPEVVEDDNGQLYITYGSFYGGISGRKLSQDGLASDPSDEVQVTIDNRYEGGSILIHRRAELLRLLRMGTAGWVQAGTWFSRMQLEKTTCFITPSIGLRHISAVTRALPGDRL
jgi:arabinan endo-1,5-alpha-L-arabinosidase